MMRFAYSPYLVLASPADQSVVGPSAAVPSVFIYRPDRKVRVSGPGRSTREVPIWGLADTGSAECILPYELAELVNPTWRGTGSISDYSGRMHAVQYGLVYLQISIDKRWLRWPAIVAFSRERGDTALWGRLGFLDFFSVTFNGPGRFFIVRFRDPPPSGFAVESLPRPRRRGARESDLITSSDQDP